MKKITPCFFLLCVTLFLSACGGGGGGSAATPANGTYTVDADGRIGSVPKAITILPSNAQ
jgi:hypothetical protein